MASGAAAVDPPTPFRQLVLQLVDPPPPSPPQEHVFMEFVSELVDSCLDGFNATVLAYGQTGSGKTYSMGTSYSGGLPEEQLGITPRAIR